MRPEKAVEEPELAWLIVHLDRANALVERVITPYTQELFADGMEQGRFRRLELDVTVTHFVSVTIGMMRAALEERLAPASESASAEILLATFGLDAGEARTIAYAEMPRM